MSRDIGQYKIFNQIGKGSFGKVYKGVDKVTNQEVALKFIEKKQKRSRDLKNLRQQNQLLKKINHPNVICLKDVIQTPKQIIIVTDYAGRDLSGVIEQRKKFPLDKVKQFSIQILNAMVYLNENRIIHRDLKPQNILIKNNHIKICDFGFAKKLSASTNFLQSMKGTPLYLAPQIVRQIKYTDKVDIWSFGCIVYELFTGRTPYYANTYQKLAPLILYQQVQYPKQMPSDLKDLICSMLQKNPSARPGWKQLKQHPFFKINDPLKQKIQNQMKQVVSIQIPEKPLLEHAMIQNKQNYSPQQILESKVIQKIENENQIQNYLQDFKQIYSDLLSNVRDGNQLRKDILFLHKIKRVFQQRGEKNPTVSNQALDNIFNILNHLIKNKKTFSNGLMNQGGNGQEDDITKNQTLIIGILVLAQVEKNYQMLQKQLRIICLLIKRNFNGVSINTEIDQEITQFVTQILLQNNKNLPYDCIRNGLIIIGTLANQALMTITNSFSYFQRIAEDNVLSKISNIYIKQEKSSIVLQCLKQFIHPVRQVPSMNSNNPNNLLHPKVQNVFRNLKQQVAQSLLKTQFLSQKSPLSVYSDSSNSIVDYCQILLQCLKVSKQTRQSFLKFNYWNQLLNCHKTKNFLFAYNSILIKQQGKCIIPRQVLANFTRQTQQNKLINMFIVQMGYDNLKKKMEKKPLSQTVYQASITYQKNILQKISQYLFYEPSIKLKSCKELYGTLQTTSKCFDEPLIELFYSIVKNISSQNQFNSHNSNNKEYCQQIFRKICVTTNSFKPNSASLFKLISLFVNDQIMRPLKSQKALIIFFYECISDFIRRQQFQYLQNTFQQSFIKVFIAKLIECLNYLIQIEQSPNQNKLTQPAIAISKQIQTSSFYRIMFMDGLEEQQFYEHLKYSQKIINKTSQIDSQFINFLGVKVIPMCKQLISTKNQQVLIEIFVFLSQIAREYPQFNNQIINTQIIKKFKQWLTENYGQNLKQKALYLIGNLAKRSQFFFGQFQSYSVIESISFCLKNHYNNSKIFKNTIYSIGNISYYSQKFYKQILPMIPYFAKAFQLNDGHLKNNLISTVSNLLRFSNIYLQQLIKSEMIKQILKIACQAGQNDVTTLSLVLSVIKKIIPYPEFYKNFGYQELKLIYQKKNLVGGDSNEAIKKIKDILQKVGEL